MEGKENVVRLRFAPHISFGGFDRPLFAALRGSADPVDQIEFAAEQGFAGIQDPFAAQREEAEQRRIGNAVAKHALENGSFVYARPQDLTTAWSSTDPAFAADLAVRVDGAIEIAYRTGARHIVILPLADPQVPRPPLQFVALSENLKRVAERADRAGKILCLEAIDARRLPAMLLHHLLDAYAIVKSVNSPALRLAFDFAHVQAMDGDILANLDRTWDAIGVIQIADHPGRLEPGTGELNFPVLLAEVARRGYTGLLELEHGWSRPGRVGEQKGLAALRQLEDNVAQKFSQQRDHA